MPVIIHGTNGITHASGGLQVGPITNGTAVATTSGTAINFTSIPSWVKRIIVNVVGVSTNGTSPPVLRLGTSGGVQNTGYSGVNIVLVASGVVVSDTTGFLIGVNTTNWSASVTISGQIILSLIDAATNTWTATGSMLGSGAIYFTGGSKVLSAVLDRVQLTTLNGTDTFDAGTMNIQWD